MRSFWSAYTLTITNRDTIDHSLTITDFDSERIITIRPNHKLKGLCLSGCSIAVDEGKPVDFSGRETVMIKSGNLSTTNFDSD